MNPDLPSDPAKPLSWREKFLPWYSTSLELTDARYKYCDTVIKARTALVSLITVAIAIFNYTNTISEERKDRAKADDESQKQAAKDYDLKVQDRRDRLKREQQARQERRRLFCVGVSKTLTTMASLEKTAPKWNAAYEEFMRLYYAEAPTVPPPSLEPLMEQAWQEVSDANLESKVDNTTTARLNTLARVLAKSALDKKQIRFDLRPRTESIYEEWVPYDSPRIAPGFKWFGEDGVLPANALKLAQRSTADPNQMKLVTLRHRFEGEVEVLVGEYTGRIRTPMGSRIVTDTWIQKGNGWMLETRRSGSKP